MKTFTHPVSQIAAHLLRRWRQAAIAAALVLATAGMLPVALAFAQDATPSPSATVTVTPPQPTPTAPLNPPWLFWFAIVVLLFALAALGIVFFYTYKIQRRFYDASEKLGRQGKAVKVIFQPAFVGGAGYESMREGEAPAPQKTLLVAGPDRVTLGVEAEYAATLDGSPADGATWSVAPADAGSINPQTGAKVKLTAAKAGALKVAATVSGAASPAELLVTAEEPQSAAVELPFIGRGYGSLAISIILLTTVILLGLAGVLSGEAVATLLGGLLGYAFGVAATGTKAGGGQEGG
jgi:hypothetical protein